MIWYTVWGERPDFPAACVVTQRISSEGLSMILVLSPSQKKKKTLVQATHSACHPLAYLDFKLLGQCAHFWRCSRRRGKKKEEKVGLRALHKSPLVVIDWMCLRAKEARSASVFVCVYCLIVWTRYGRARHNHRLLKLLSRGRCQHTHLHSAALPQAGKTGLHPRLSVCHPSPNQAPPSHSPLTVCFVELVPVECVTDERIKMYSSAESLRLFEVALQDGWLRFKKQMSKECRKLPGSLDCMELEFSRWSGPMFALDV